mgnify:CR=1 FL=1
MSNLTTKDLDYKKIIENYNKVEELEKILDEVIDKLNKLIRFKKNIESIIDDRINLYMENKEDKEDNYSTEKSQTKSIEPKKIENNNVEKPEEEKEKKLDISKFIEAFSQEFSFIDKEQFNDEMENDEIMGKIIELIKRMLGIKDNEINDKKIEIDGLKVKKAKLEKDIEEKENKNNLLEGKKVELEGEIKNINYKVNELETSKNKLEGDIKNLNKDLENKREFADGVLRIEFYDRHSKEAGLAAIKERNYKIRRNRKRFRK